MKKKLARLAAEPDDRVSLGASSAPAPPANHVLGRDERHHLRQHRQVKSLQGHPQATVVCKRTADEAANQRKNAPSPQVTARKYRVKMQDFELLKVLGTGAYGKVFLVRKLTGHDQGKLFAMKVLRKEIVAQKTKTLDHTKTERKVLESIRNEPFLVTMHYAFQTKTKLHLILDYVNGGELFTHLFLRDHFKEDDAKIYIGELILALEKLHKVSAHSIHLFRRTFLAPVYFLDPSNELNSHRCDSVGANFWQIFSPTKQQVDCF